MNKNPRSRLGIKNLFQFLFCLYCFFHLSSLKVNFKIEFIAASLLIHHSICKHFAPHFKLSRK